MKRAVIKLFSVATLMLAGVVGAAAQMQGERVFVGELSLTLEQAIEMALSDNPTIKIAELEVERYDYVRKTTLGSLMPALSGSGTFHRTLINQSMSEGMTIGGNQFNTISAGLEGSVALFAPAVYRTLKMNRVEAEAAVESARSTKIDLVAAVKVSFYNVMLAERSLQVLEASSQTAKQSVDETKIMFDNGLTSEYDLLTAQVQYSNLQPTIMQTRTSIAVAKEVLKMYLSIPEDVKIAVVGDFGAMQSEVVAASRNLSFDFSNNSALRSLALSEDLLRASLKVQNSARMPTLAAYAQITYQGTNMEAFSFSATSDSAASSGYWWQHPASAGLSLSVPIFSGLTNTNKARQIKNQIEQIELQRIYAEQSTAVSLSTAISNIYTARERYMAELQTVEQATKAYSISNTRYNAGAGTMLELNSARLSMTQAELNLSQATYDLLSAKSEYDKIVGLDVEVKSEE
ncbi:MAG: TolC family protein [Rikenellaceae bacterium]